MKNRKYKQMKKLLKCLKKLGKHERYITLFNDFSGTVFSGTDEELFSFNTVNELYSWIKEGGK